MQITSARIDPDIFGGRTLAGLMALYESNHARLFRLLGGSVPMLYGAVSKVPGEPDLHLSVLERSRYTTTYHLTCYFEDNGVQVPDPDLHVRIYHDARVAETMYCGRNRHWQLLRPYRIDAGTEIQRRWEMNLLLNKWLEFCLARGHCFASQPRHQTAVS